MYTEEEKKQINQRTAKQSNDIANALAAILGIIGIQMEPRQFMATDTGVTSTDNPSYIMPQTSSVTTQVIQPVQTIDDYAYYTRGSIPQELQPLISQSAKKYGLDPSILAAMLFQESGINPNTKDNVNVSKITGRVSRDRGIAQINDLAHPEISDEQARDPNFAIPFMAQELANAYKEKGSWPQAIASYNVGRGMTGTGEGTGRDEYGLGELGRKYVMGIRQNLSPEYADRIGLPNYQTW